MKITTRLEISTADEKEFTSKLCDYTAQLKAGLAINGILDELVKFHRQQMNAAFRLGLNERIRKESKD